ncbi:MBL fold metallo-hydrolase [Myxococcota bacterium]
MRLLTILPLIFSFACTPASQQPAEPAPTPAPDCRLSEFDLMEDEIPTDVVAACETVCSTTKNVTVCRDVGDAHWVAATAGEDPQAAYPAAAKMYAICCERDDPDCCNNLGLAYRAGHGVPKDQAEYLRFLHKACELGSEEACMNRDLDGTTSTLAGPAKITFIDVDEGDAILIQVGDFDALVDTGSNGKWDGKLKDALETVNDPLEMLFLTHPHEDHYGQVDEVLELVEVQRVITNGESSCMRRPCRSQSHWRNESS